MSEYLYESNRFIDFLRNCIDKIDQYDPPIYLKEEGVLKSFFSLLMCHKNLCYNADIVVENDVNVSDEYVLAFKEFCEFSIALSRGENTSFYVKKYNLSDFPRRECQLDEVIQILKEGMKDNPSSTSKYLWDIITYNNGIDKNIKKHIPKALNEVKKLFKWLAEYKQSIFQDNYFRNFYSKFMGDNPNASLLDMVVIMQEVLYTRQQHLLFEKNVI